MAVAVNKFVLLFLVGYCTCHNLPLSFTLCDRKQSNFSECLTKAVGDAVRLLNKSVSEMEFISDPLYLPFIPGKSGGKIIAFYEYIKYPKIWGFSNANCSKVEMNFETKNLTIECTIPELVDWAEYHYVGKIYDLSFNESGPAMFTHRDVKTHLSFLLGEYMAAKSDLSFLIEDENTSELDRIKKFSVERTKFIIESGSIDIHLGNLFKGDHERSKKLNQYLNDNALEVFNDVKENYEAAIGEEFANFFNNILVNIPASEFFGEE